MWLRQLFWQLVTLATAASMLYWATPAHPGIIIGSGATTASYYINEGFESGTAPTSPSTWTDVWGTYAWNYSAAPLDGTYSMSISGGSSGMCTPALTSQGTYYVTIHYKLAARPSTNNYDIIQFYSGASNVGSAGVQPDGKVYAIANAPGGSSSGTVITAGTAVYLKIKHSKGVSNGTTTIWSSTDGTTWTQEATDTDGTSNIDINALCFIGIDSSTAVYYDTLKVDPNDISDARSGH